MISNLKKYEKDLEGLIKKGEFIHLAIQKECHPDQFEKLYKKALGDEKEYKNFLKKIPRFSEAYQSWYSEAQAVIKQLIPDRLDDFKRLYEKPKTSRKEITHENYMIEDALIGLRITRGWEKEEITGASAAVPRIEQQLGILKSVRERFQSSLFDIKQLVQADLFDSELESASELLKVGYVRGAGAIAGVVLEGHLRQVCDNHNVSIRKKNPTINDYTELLKKNEVLDTPEWRKIQHLADIRNMCDHKKSNDPKEEDVADLISGVEKVIKNLF